MSEFEVLPHESFQSLKSSTFDADGEGVEYDLEVVSRLILTCVFRLFIGELLRVMQTLESSRSPSLSPFILHDGPPTAVKKQKLRYVVEWTEHLGISTSWSRKVVCKNYSDAARFADRMRTIQVPQQRFSDIAVFVLKK